MKTAFCQNEIRPAENLIKPVVYEDFWGPFAEKWPESIKKALGFAVKLKAILPGRKTLRLMVKTAFSKNEKGLRKTL